MGDVRSAIVTGGASGIGKACVEGLIAQGWSVTIADLNPEGETIAAAIRDAGGAAQFVKTDVSDEASIKTLVDAAVAKFGQLHGAVNCAGLLAVQSPSKRSAWTSGTASTGSTCAACFFA